MFCVNCGSQIADGTQFCPNCGASQAQQQSASQPQQPQQAQQAQQPVYQAQPVYQQQPNQAGRSKAIASLVLGIISLCVAWWSWLGIIGLVCAIVGLIMGKKATDEMAAAGTTYSAGMAKAGKILSIIGLVASVLMLVVWIIIAIVACSAAAAGGLFSNYYY